MQSTVYEDDDAHANVSLIGRNGDLYTPVCHHFVWLFSHFHYCSTCKL